jgi:hypothetical protein
MFRRNNRRPLVPSSFCTVPACPQMRQCSLLIDRLGDSCDRRWNETSCPCMVGPTISIIESRRIIDKRLFILRIIYDINFFFIFNLAGMKHEATKKKYKRPIMLTLATIHFCDIIFFNFNYDCCRTPNRAPKTALPAGYQNAPA